MELEDKNIVYIIMDWTGLGTCQINIWLYIREDID